MGLSHLLEALERDANGEIARLRAAAETEAARITADSSAALAQRRRVALDESGRHRRHEVERALTVARRAARRAILEARQRCLDHVFAAVTAQLPAALQLPEYRKSLPAAVERALAALGAGPRVIRCPPSMLPLLDGLGKRDEVTILTDANVGNGFLVSVPDGAVEVLDTLEESLERHRPALARRVLEQLGFDP
jgi:vacuolar-type H+-ATPase subunit E/Vma4